MTFKSIYLIALLAIVPQNTLALEDSNCSEVIDKKITVAEFITSGQSFSKLKTSLVNLALKEAVQQVSGTEIRDFSSLNVASVNGNENEDFGASQTSKTKGKVQSYSITKQEVINMGVRDVLEITINASVCIQDKSLTKDILLVGDFLYKNTKKPALRRVIQSAFSQKSNSFELGSGHPNNNYHDIVITGRIDNISYEKKVDRKTLEEERKAAIFKNFFGAISKTGKENPFSKMLGDPQGSVSALNKVVVEVSVSISANHRAENRNYTGTATSKQEVSEDSVESITNALAIEATKKASKSLYIKLNNDLTSIKDF